MSFFEKVEPKFQVVKKGEDVRPELFLPAARSILPFIDMLGTAFTICKTDIKGNITTLQKKLDTNPDKYKASFRVMMEEEKEEYTKIRTVSNAVLWLKRALEYFHAFVSYFVEDHKAGAKTESMVPVCKKAYEATLMVYHSWIAQKGFAVLCLTTPWRRDFIKTLAYGQEGMDEDVIKHMDLFALALKSNLDVIGALLIDLDLDTPDII